MTVQNWWEGLNFNGTTGFVLAKKSKVLKFLLKNWNKVAFINIEVKKAKRPWTILICGNKGEFLLIVDEGGES